MKDEIIHLRFILRSSHCCQSDVSEQKAEQSSEDDENDAFLPGDVRNGRPSGLRLLPALINRLFVSFCLIWCTDPLHYFRHHQCAEWRAASCQMKLVSMKAQHIRVDLNRSPPRSHGKASARFDAVSWILTSNDRYCKLSLAVCVCQLICGNRKHFCETDEWTEAEWQWGSDHFKGKSQQTFILIVTTVMSVG